MLNIKVDTTDLESLLKMGDVLKQACKQAAEDFSKDVSGYITEQAIQKLHSRRDKYIENLYVKQLAENTWIVGLNEKATWIEDGSSQHSMLKDLLKGKQHRAIPLEKGSKTGESPMTSAQKDLLSTIKQHFESQKKTKLEDIELDKTGKAKLGSLHSFDIKSAPLKTKSGIGQGKGPIGKPVQGASRVPYLQGVRIYQKLVDKGGKKQVKRVITTFRMASVTQEGTGLWDHPGNKAMNFFEQAIEWGKKRWDDEYSPKLLNQILTAI